MRTSGVHPPARAFTLIEVMIALMIFSIVIVAIYAAWSSILRSTKVGHAAAVEVQRDRIAVRSLEEALFGAQLFQENVGFYSFLSDTRSDFAALSFVSRLPQSFPRSGNFEGLPLRRVRFTVEPDRSGVPSLMVRQSPVLYEFDQEEEENPLVLAHNVKLFTVEFWGQRSTDWEPEWLFTNQLPRLVRFALAYGPDEKQSKAPPEVISRVVVLGSVAIPVAMQRSAPVGGRLPPTAAPGAPPVGGRKGGAPR